MRFLHDYIEQFKDDGSPAQLELAKLFQDTKESYDVFLGGDPKTAFEIFVERYNWAWFKLT